MNPYLHINRLEFILTDYCTGRCKHCSAAEMVNHPRTERHVPVAESVRAIRDLAEMFDMQSVMTFGGEPLLYPEVTCAIHRAAMEAGIPKHSFYYMGYQTLDDVYNSVVRPLLGSFDYQARWA